jgi:hypothetical protein
MYRVSHVSLVNRKDLSTHRGDGTTWRPLKEHMCFGCVNNDKTPLAHHQGRYRGAFSLIHLIRIGPRSQEQHTKPAEPQLTMQQTAPPCAAPWW